MTLEAYHDEILRWTLGLLRPGRAFVLGVNGPQGGGKTTLTTALCRRLEALGKRAVTVSVDDFYLTRAEQVALAGGHPANPYLQQRGYPGTHDVAMGARTLDTLAGARGPVRIPRYDKSAHQGQGDRLPPSSWAEVTTPVDLVFFEGWMLGFTPAPPPAAPSLAEVNDLLRAYGPWLERLDGFLHLDPVEYRYVLDWRVEAEEKMKASGRPGMSEAGIRAYIAMFLPAYELWLPGLRARPPVAGPYRRVRIGRDRLPVG